MAGPLIVAVGDVARHPDPRMAPDKILHSEFGANVSVVDRDKSSPEEFAAALARADVYITRKHKAGDPAVPHLRLLQVPATGFEGIEKSALPAGCAVCNVFGHDVGIGEYVVAAMLQWATRFDEQRSTFREGKWAFGPSAGAGPHGEIFGTTLGILGYGHIGAAVAARARAFSVRIVTCSLTGATHSGVDHSYRRDELDAFLSGLDWLLISCPLNDQTKGLVDAEFLRKLPGRCVIINVARAAITDEKALFEALSERRIGGAILDVWWNYPSASNQHPTPSNLPFLELPNVLGTPHVAVWSSGLIQRRWNAVVENIKRLIGGQALVNRV